MPLVNVYSAAVIGRQLRQQNTITRTSGPLVPPVYRGRPRTPSVLGRPYSPVATSSTQGTGAGVTSEPISNTYSSSVKHHHLQSKSKSDQAAEQEARLRCTWRCLCITLKALSFGILLLVTGTTLFVIGFVIENDYIKEQGIRPDQFNAEQRTKLMMYRNLTYAGPVVMGLGTVVIVAALVLTFEERDTLGVKTVPGKTSVSASKTPVPVVIAGLSDVGHRKSTIASVSSTLASGLTAAGFASTRRPGSDMSLTTGHMTMSGVKEGMFDRGRLHETIQETALTVAGSMAEAIGSADVGKQRRSQVSAKRPVSRDDCCIFTTSSSSGTSSCQRHSVSIEQDLFGFGSPLDAAISDPEACSLRLPDNERRPALCSCSASPTLSTTFDFFLPDDDSIHDHLLDQQRLQHRLLQQQQRLIREQQQQLQLQQRLLQEHKQRLSMNRRPGTAVAFIESDSLSTASSSDDNVFTRRPSYGRACASAQNFQRPSRNKRRTCYAAVHRDYNEESGDDVSALLLHPDDAIRRRISTSSSSNKQDFQRTHDKSLPLLRPPEVL